MNPVQYSAASPSARFGRRLEPTELKSVAQLAQHHGVVDGQTGSQESLVPQASSLLPLTSGGDKYSLQDTQESMQAVMAGAAKWAHDPNAQDVFLAAIVMENPDEESADLQRRNLQWESRTTGPDRYAELDAALAASGVQINREERIIKGLSGLHNVLFVRMEKAESSPSPAPRVRSFPGSQLHELIHRLRYGK